MNNVPQQLERSSVLLGDLKSALLIAAALGAMNTGFVLGHLQHERIAMRSGVASVSLEEKARILEELSRTSEESEAVSISVEERMQILEELNGNGGGSGSAVSGEGSVDE